MHLGEKTFGEEAFSSIYFYCLQSASIEFRFERFNKITLLKSFNFKCTGKDSQKERTQVGEQNKIKVKY